MKEEQKEQVKVKVIDSNVTQPRCSNYRETTLL